MPKNHSGTDLPPTIFHSTNKAATTATSKSATTKHNNKDTNQPNVISLEKRCHCHSNKNRQNHCNHKTHDNHDNPNFEPALKWFEKERRGRVANYITINKMVKKSTAPWAVCKKKVVVTYRDSHHFREYLFG
eukprot:14047997-Ditylum_brightwellii.AAC.1